LKCAMAKNWTAEPLWLMKPDQCNPERQEILTGLGVAAGLESNS